MNTNKNNTPSNIIAKPPPTHTQRNATTKQAPRDSQKLPRAIPGSFSGASLEGPSGIDLGDPREGTLSGKCLEPYTLSGGGWPGGPGGGAWGAHCAQCGSSLHSLQLRAETRNLKVTETNFVTKHAEIPSAGSGVGGFLDKLFEGAPNYHMLGMYRGLGPARAPAAGPS